MECGYETTNGELGRNAGYEMTRHHFSDDIIALDGTPSNYMVYLKSLFFFPLGNIQV